jgi:hypothetical protein
MINWISVKEQPLEPKKEVLLLFQYETDPQEIHYGYLQDKKESPYLDDYWSITGNCGLERDTITHWAEINLPEEKK